MIRPAFTSIGILLACLFGGCSSKPNPQPTIPLAGPFEKPGLHNVIHVTNKLYSGSQPEGDAGFLSLEELGIKTIISVDGSLPDVATAKAHGLRYVHLPIGYDGVAKETAERIAKAIRDLPGPVYLHCHHGMHRGPAAAATAVRCLDGQCSQEAALAILKAAGTDPRYAGLFASVESARPMTPNEFDATPDTFPEIAEGPDIVRRMVQIDETWDRLKACQKAGWKSPLNHPDVTPAHEALQLVEHYREAARIPGMEKRPKAFHVKLAEAESAASEFERALRTAAEPTIIGAAFSRNAAVCTRCHQEFRDTK